MKKFWGEFWILLGVGFFIYFIGTTVVTPGYSFNFFFLSLAIFFLGYGVATKKLDRNKLFIKLNKVIKVLLSIAVSMVILFGGVMGTFAIKENKEKSDYIVVLGAGLLNGDQISATLKHRLDSAIEYIKDNKNGEKIVVSGGKGSDEKISEAEAMKRYLINHGIDETTILMEDKSTSTFENFKFSKEVIANDSLKNIEEIKIKIFTNGFHMFRSNFLSKRVGFKNVTSYSAKTPWYLIPSYYSREVLAIGKSALLDK